MAIVENFASGSYPSAGVLSTAQTGTGDSQNIIDRGGELGPALLEIVSTIGATPSVTVNIQGSVDGVNFFNIPYCEVATPETPSVASFAITTATTTRKILRPNHPWRFIKFVLSANTNVTIASATLYQF